jgi:hypothetical protein
VIHQKLHHPIVALQRCAMEGGLAAVIHEIAFGIQRTF